METKTKRLTNFKIIEREDIKGQNYFIIFDNDNEGGKNAYFCWSDNLKDAIAKNRNNMKKIEIEYTENEKGNRVINLSADTSADIWV